MDNTFERMQISINEANNVALRELSSKVEKLSSMFESFIEDFVEHCEGEDGDGDSPIKISGTSRWKA